MWIIKLLIDIYKLNYQYLNKIHIRRFTLCYLTILMERLLKIHTKKIQFNLAFTQLHSWHPRNCYVLSGYLLRFLNNTV